MKSFNTYIAEAVSEDKLKHLTHAEEHVIKSGAEGYKHAVRTLHAVHQAIQGNPSPAHITSKYDGSPSIVFGHHPTTGKFFVASKSAFNVSPKLNYTPEDIEANHGHAPGLVDKLKEGLKHLPKVAPARGIYQGDVMHSGAKDVKKVGDEYHFKPQLITYTTPKGSAEGRKISASKFGVVVHTQYKGNDFETMKAHFKPDADKSFKQHSDVHVIHPSVDPTDAHLTPADSKKFQQHLDAAEAAHQKLARHYDKIEPHSELLNRYVNRTVDDGSTPNHGDYSKFVDARAAKDIEKLKSEKGKAAREAAHKLTQQQLKQNKQHFDNFFDVHNNVAAAKDVLVHALQPATEKFGTKVDDQKVKGEGTVVTVDGRPTKLVDRAEFSRLNRLAHAPKKEESKEDSPTDKPADKPDTAVMSMAFGRMNPPTAGHLKVADKVKSVAKKFNAQHVIIASHSTDSKKNPLSPEKKVKHLKRAFGEDTKIVAATKDQPTILHHAATLSAKGIKHLHVVAGSDRVKETKTLLDKYNDKKSAHGHYKFDSITVHSSGERDPDAEGTTGISGTKMRQLAAQGDFKTFAKHASPKMSHEHKLELYNDVRTGMGIKQ